MIAIVSGFPRSGTSAMMRLLDSIGIPIFSQGRHGDEHNPLGYFETPILMAKASRGEPIDHILDALEGRAIKLPLPHNLKTLPLDRQYLIIWLDRDPLLSAMSLRKMNLAKGATSQPEAEQLAENIRRARADAFLHLQAHPQSFQIFRVNQPEIDTSGPLVKDFLAPLLVNTPRSENEIIRAISSYHPPLIRQIPTAIRAAHRFARAGFATTPPEALAERESTCKACPEWDAQALNATGRCRKCGCSTWAKLRMATERCPLGKWEAVDKPTN
jgi:hypothetical protein